jgi:hypothetical protein
MQIEAAHISLQQLDAFVVTAVQAWLHRRQVCKGMSPVVQERLWSEVFEADWNKHCTHSHTTRRVARDSAMLA